MNRAALAGAAFGLAVTLVLTTAGTASAAQPDGSDLWACTDEERAEMHVPPGRECWLTGAELDRRGWHEVDADEPAWCWPDDGAPAWVRKARERMCGGQQ